MDAAGVRVAHAHAQIAVSPSPTYKLIERCSNGVEDQGAEEAFMGSMPREKRFNSFGSRLPSLTALLSRRSLVRPALLAFQSCFSAKAEAGQR